MKISYFQLLSLVISGGFSFAHETAITDKKDNINNTNPNPIFCPQTSPTSEVTFAAKQEDTLLIGESSGVISIWSIKYKKLLKKFNNGAEVLFTRIDKKRNLVFCISQNYKEKPLLSIYSYSTGKKLSSQPINEYGFPYTSFFLDKDAKYIYSAYADSAIKKNRVCRAIIIIDSCSKQIKTIEWRQINSAQELKTYIPEIKNLQIFRGKGFNTWDHKNAFLNDGEKSNTLLSQVGSDIELKNESSKIIEKYSGVSNKYNPAGFTTSKDSKKIATYSRNELAISDLITGKKNNLTIDTDFILSADFSMDGTKIAVLSVIENEPRGGWPSTRCINSDNFKLTIYDSLSLKEISTKNTDNIFSVLGGQFSGEISEAGIRWCNGCIMIVGSKGCLSLNESNLNSRLYSNFTYPSTYTYEPIIYTSYVNGEESSVINVLDPRSGVCLMQIPYTQSKNSSDRAFMYPPSIAGTQKFDISSNLDAYVIGSERQNFGGLAVQSSPDKIMLFDKLIKEQGVNKCQFLSSGKLFASTDKNDASSSTLYLLDYTDTPKVVSSLDVPRLVCIEISVDKKTCFGIEADGSVAAYSINEHGIKLISRYKYDGLSSVIFNDDLAYLSHGNVSQLISFTVGYDSYPLEQFDLRLNRPDIVLERLGAPKEAVETAKSLREKRLKRMGVTEEMLKPDFHLPELQIVGDVPATTAKDQLELQIKATDDKYPLDRLRVYVNNVPVNGRDGELLRDQMTQSLEKTIPIKLAAGRNKIQVSVLNSAGAESLYANAEVNCTADRPKPKLYAVALGVSQYDRPEWCLKYAAKDAIDLIGKLKAKAGSSYSEVKPLLLTDKEVTKESATKIKEFLSGATIDDTVMIFMAGHGLLDDKYDYYFGTTDIDPAKPSERGMPYEAIDTILAEVPSLKKALLMDTCHAGELDDDEKKELAATDGSAAKELIPSADTTTNSSPLAGKVAMRAIGSRGMQLKAVEGSKGKSDWYEKLQDMFVDLRRGSGATVISSSQGAEYAFESSEQSNGLFTYALMEALDGKATPNKDGKITISSVGDYVKKRVQDLTKGKQNPNLRGVNLEEDFDLVGNMTPVNALVENNQISIPQNAIPATANPSGDAMQGVIQKYHQAIQDRDEATVRSLLPDQVDYYKSGRVPMSEVLADIKGDWKRYSSTTYQVSDFQKIDNSNCSYVLDYSLAQGAKILKGKLLMTATISIPEQKISSLKASVVSAH